MTVILELLVKPIKISGKPKGKSLFVFSIIPSCQVKFIQKIENDYNFLKFFSNMNILDVCAETFVVASGQFWIVFSDISSGFVTF